MGLADIEAVMNSIPAKKEELLKAFEELQSCSSSFASFTFQWKDIEDHISPIEKSIRKRFQKQKALDTPLETENPAAPLPAVIANEDQDVDPHEMLKAICINMNAKALRSYIIRTRKDHLAIRREVIPAFQFASDPVSLVLDSFEGFAPIEQKEGGEVHTIRRACFTLLESLHQMALDIKPLQKERARRLAIECEGLISPGKVQNDVTVLLLLQLIVTFGLVEFLQFDAVLELLVMVAARKMTVDLCMNSIFREKVPALIEKLNSMGRQVDSIKFVIAFDLIAKYPPDHLLRAYLNESKWWAADRGTLKQKHNSLNFKHEAIKREISALKKALKVVEDCRLHHVYHPRSLQEQIRGLEKLLAENWRACRLKEPNITDKMWRQHERATKKQLKSSNSSETVAAAQLESQNPHQPGFVDFSNSYGFGAPPSFYFAAGEAWMAT